MSKYSLFAIILAIASGIFIGISYSYNTTKDEVEIARQVYQLKLRHSSDSLIDVIHRRDVEILKLDDIRKIDSVKITNMLILIEQDKVKTEQKRAQAKKFTPDEKANFILNRYKH